MCGLVGVAGDVGGSRKNAFVNLLVVDSLRGMHSTGVASVDRYLENGSKTRLAKMPGGPSIVMSTNQFKDATTGSLKALIGHNRLATVGEHTVENAHPFDFDKIVGAHNGTLHATDRKKLYKFDEYGTDSEALFSDINMFGVQAAIEKLTHWDSAYALVWYDKEKGTINFLRNQQRPLMYSYSEDRQSILWASERRFIEFAAAHAGLKLQVDEKGNSFYYPEPDMHCFWEIPKINEKFDLVQKEEIKPKLRVEQYDNQTGWYWMNGDWFEGKRADHAKNYPGDQTTGNLFSVPNTNTFHKLDGTTTTYRSKNKGVGPVTSASGGTKKTKGATDNVVPFVFGGHKRLSKAKTAKFRGPYKDTHGNVINKPQFEEIVNQGCCMCVDANQSWGTFIQPFKSKTDPKYDYVCEACYHDDDTYDMLLQMMDD